MLDKCLSRDAAEKRIQFADAIAHRPMSAEGSLRTQFPNSGLNEKQEELRLPYARQSTPLVCGSQYRVDELEGGKEALWIFGILNGRFPLPVSNEGFFRCHRLSGRGKNERHTSHVIGGSLLLEADREVVKQLLSDDFVPRHGPGCQRTT